jgi:hypothetical protein
LGAVRVSIAPAFDWPQAATAAKHGKSFPLSPGEPDVQRRSRSEKCRDPQLLADLTRLCCATTEKRCLTPCEAQALRRAFEHGATLKDICGLRCTQYG